MLLKGLQGILRPGAVEIIVLSGLAFAAAYAASRPYISARVRTLGNRRPDINQLFNVPLIAGAALLSFAHGANDVATAVGPMAAIVATFQQKSAIEIGRASCRVRMCT